MPPSYILAHDLGTTGDKASLYDANGQALASSFVGYGVEYPHPAWAEQNPLDWWQAVCTATHTLLVQAHILPQQVACISFSGQMMACVAVDRQARPLRSAIIWADMRSVAEAQILVDTIGADETYRITGHRASPSYSGPKILWVRNHQPEIYQQSYKFLHAKDFIVASLTGKFVTDVSDASGMNLFDLQTRTWSPQILDALQLNPAQLPEIHASAEVVGEVLPGVAEEVGLAPGTPVVIGAGDGQCATVGAGVVREGSAYNYIGSSSWIGVTARVPFLDPLQRTFTFAHMIPERYTPIGTVQSAGGSYQWARDVICQAETLCAGQLRVSPYSLMDLQAEQSPPGANNLLYFPYLIGERSPYWNPKARGVFFGLTVKHTHADLLRAVLEGVTFSLRLTLDALIEQGAQIQAMRAIGGGARGRIWREIMADIYGMPVQRPALLEEATSLGAAIAGGVGVGMYPDFSVAEAFTPIVDTIYPNPHNRETYEQLFAIYKEAYPAFVPLYDRLAEL